ncbi:hypothetical protein D3C80_907430 [compost metagenome]
MLGLGVELHGGLLDIGSFFGQVDGLGLVHHLGEVQLGGGGHGLATRRNTVQRMTAQAAIPAVYLVGVEVGPQGLAAVFQLPGQGRVEHVQRRGWRAVADTAFHATDPERVAWVFQGAIGVAVGIGAVDQRQRTDGFAHRRLVGVVVIAFVLVFAIIVVGGDQLLRQFGYHHHLAWHRRHGFARQRHDGRDRRTGNDFAIRQCPGASSRLAAAQGKRGAVETILALPAHFQPGAFFEHIVHPPHGPHALGEVRVEVAVVDGIARHAVAVARTTVGNLVGVADTRADALGVDVVGVVVVGVEQPLVAMQVEDVLLMAIVGVAELGEIANVAVVHVGRLGRVQRHTGLYPHGAGGRRLAWANVLQADVGRHVHQGTDIAHSVCAEEELFVGAR